MTAIGALALAIGAMIIGNEMVDEDVGVPLAIGTLLIVVGAGMLGAVVFQ